MGHSSGREVCHDVVWLGVGLFISDEKGWKTRLDAVGKHVRMEISRFEEANVKHIMTLHGERELESV